MISRVADHCFWFGRYVERAEATARMLSATASLALDAELPPAQVWRPVVVVSGEEQAFHTRIAEKLHTSGVEVKLSVWPNQLHVFPFFAPILSEGRDGCVEIGSYIRGKTS